MKQKKWLLPISILVLSIIVTILYSYIVSIKIADDSLLMMAAKLTAGDGFRQILIGVIFYVYGYIFVEQITEGSMEYTPFLALPIGMVCWSMASLLLVVTGIPYTLLTTSGVLAVFLLIIILWKRAKIDIGKFVQTLCIAIGVANVASTGALLLMHTSDSAYYIMKYGEILAIDGGITDNVGYWLTWTGITNAFWGSLVKFFGVYSMGTLHHMLVISFLLGMVVLTYRMLDVFAATKTRMLATAGVVGMLLITPAIFLLGHWQMQNTYYMIYMCFYILLCYHLPNAKAAEKKGIHWLLGLLSIMLGMMRIESIVLMCILVICISTLKIEKKELLGSMLLPLGIAQIAYWIRVYLVMGNIISGMMSKQVAVIMALSWMITVLYICVFRKWVEQFFKGYMPHFILAMLLLLNVALAALKWDVFQINIAVTASNLANASWGYFPWLVLIGVMVAVQFGVHLNFFDLIWIGYILGNFAIGMGRIGSFRLGEGDSVNRILLSVVPVIFISGIMHYRTYKEQKEGKTSW